MLTETGIYWDSIDSQRSTSAGSSGECSSRSGGRHYVDPWDLENYAYLRRHSVGGMSEQCQENSQSNLERISKKLIRQRARSDYWYKSKDHRYAAAGLVDDLYGPSKEKNNACHYQNPIYEDDVPDYVAYPVYAPLSELRRSETEVHKRTKHKYKLSETRDSQRSDYLEAGIRATNIEEAVTVPRCPNEDSSTLINRERIIVGMVPPSRLDLNTYGHLKIDYTNSWNSLNRKISKS